MKYIRTKDGIEKANYGEDFKEGKSYFYKVQYVWQYGDHYTRKKTKQYNKQNCRVADTIEELCDKYVCICDKKYYSIRSVYDQDGNMMQKPPFYSNKNPINGKQINYEYYGAIWTDKGLIYVAKMNDKGELELL